MKLIKKIIAVLLVMVMTLAILPVTEIGLAAHAATIVANGSCGADNSTVTWKLDSEGILTISGNGAMKKWSSNHIDWFSRRNDIKTVVIENGVTSITKWAFSECDNISSISIPDSVTSIEGFSLGGKMESIDIPQSVTSLSGGAFYACQNLRMINVSSDNTSYRSALGIVYSKDKSTIVAYPHKLSSGAMIIPYGTKHIADYIFLDMMI